MRAGTGQPRARVGAKAQRALVIEATGAHPPCLLLPLLFPDQLPRQTGTTAAYCLPFTKGVDVLQKHPGGTPPASNSTVEDYKKTALFDNVVDVTSNDGNPLGPFGIPWNKIKGKYLRPLAKSFGVRNTAK